MGIARSWHKVIQKLMHVSRKYEGKRPLGISWHVLHIAQVLHSL